MAITTVYTYPLNGSQRDFNIPFEYLARRFVTLTLIGQNRRELVLLSDYRFTSKSTVQTNVAWGAANGYEWIEIRRNTSATDRLVDFSDGSILRASDLNVSQVQTMHIAEEARNMVADTIATNNDGNLDARGRRLVNLADAVESGDAVTLRQERQWAGSALNQADRSKNEADRATAQADKAVDWATRSANSGGYAANQAVYSKASADAAKVSETNSQNSAVNSFKWAANPEDQVVNNGNYSALHYSRKAAASATAAGTYATNAGTYAANAYTYMGQAQAQADRAKTEADKLGGMNSFAATLDAVWGNTVRFKPNSSIQTPMGEFVGNITVHSGADDSGANNGPVPMKSPTLRFINGAATENRWFVWAGNGGALNFEKPGKGVVMSLNPDTTVNFAGRVLAPSGVRSNTTIKAGGQIKVNNDGNQEDDAWFAALSCNTLTFQDGSGGNKHIWFRDASGAEQALMYVSPSGEIRFRIREQQKLLIHQNGLTVSGSVWTGDGTAALWTDGNVQGSIWGNRNLADFLRDPGWETFGATTIMAYNNGAVAVNPGAVVDGSVLKWSSHNGTGDIVGFGQWKCCGYGNRGGATLWRRVG